jgi:hypothetical protein
MDERKIGIRQNRHKGMPNRGIMQIPPKVPKEKKKAMIGGLFTPCCSIIQQSMT